MGNVRGIVASVAFPHTGKLPTSTNTFMEMVTDKCTRTTFLPAETHMEIHTWKAGLRLRGLLESSRPPGSRSCTVSKTSPFEIFFFVAVLLVLCASLACQHQKPAKHASNGAKMPEYVN